MPHSQPLLVLELIRVKYVKFKNKTWYYYIVEKDIANRLLFSCCGKTCSFVDWFKVIVIYRVVVLSYLVNISAIFEGGSL